MLQARTRSIAHRSVRPAAGRWSAALLAVSLAALPLWAPPAAADTSPYYVGASAAYTQQANLLRLGDSQTTPAGYSRSDSITTTALLAGFDQPFGRQRARADLSLQNNRYRSNSIYNNQSYAASAGLDWTTIERVSGKLEGSVNRSLSSFNNYYGLSAVTQRNLQTVSNVNADVNVGLVTEYSLLLNLGHRSISNSLDLPLVKARDFNQDNGSVGVRWMPRSSTFVGLSLGHSVGRYPNYLQTAAGLQADRFKQDSIDLTTSLRPSGASGYDARLSYSKTHYDLNAQRNFSGLTGNLGWQWQPHSRLRVDTRLSRNTGQNSYGLFDVFGLPASSDYSQVTNTFRLKGDYEVTGKISATAALQLADRHIVNTVQDPIFPSQASGRDRSTTLSAGSRWAPVRSVLLGCDLSRERRSASGQITFPLNDHSVSCFGQFQLQR